MKELIVILLLLSPFSFIAQESESNESKLSIGVNFSPNYSYRTLNSSDDEQYLVDMLKELDNPSFGFNSGLVVQYLIIKKLEIELGFQFSRQTHKYKNISLIDANLNTIGSVDYEPRYHYIEIPFRVNYRIINQKFFCYISSGVSINKFINDKSKSWITYDDGNTKVEYSESSGMGYNKTLIGLIGGIGFGYHITEKLNFRLDPIFRYSLTPISESPFKQNNYSIGCQIGVNMKL